MREAARELETAFLAEMLKLSGLHQERGSFGGGASESQFGSYLLTAQSREIVRAGGLGLSEVFFRAMTPADGGVTHAAPREEPPA